MLGHLRTALSKYTQMYRVEHTLKNKSKMAAKIVESDIITEIIAI